jgi:hypothetical protein
VSDVEREEEGGCLDVVEAGRGIERHVGVGVWRASRGSPYRCARQARMVTPSGWHRTVTPPDLEALRANPSRPHHILSQGNLSRCPNGLDSET